MGAQWKQKGKIESAAAKSKAFNKVTKELVLAAKAGADPGMNPRLRMAIDAAKKVSMPRDNMERAIKRGAGLLDEPANFETVTYEGFAPHRVPVIVECLTDNKNRTATSVRVLFRKGQLGNTGSVSWDFRHLGMIQATPEAGAGDAEDAAIEAGAQEVESGDEGAMLFLTEPSDLDSVSRALATQKWHVTSAVLGWKAKNPVKVEDEAARAEVEAFLHALDEDDDVQHLYVGME